MVLFKDNDDPQELDEKCKTNYMYTGQKHIQRLLVLIAVVCVPWMLIVKPFMEMREHNQKASARQHAVNGQGETQPADEPFDTTEVFILQGIHTIEYVLGSVSHTASYLRLWALSSPCPVVRSIVEYGVEKWAGHRCMVWWCHLVGHLQLLGTADSQHFVFDGGFICFPSYPPFALGGISNKILQGRRIPIHSILVRIYTFAS